MTWMLRGLLGVGGAVLAFVAWPVANGALQAQKADTAFFEFRTGQPPDLAGAEAALQALDQGVAADPVAGRRLGRAEMLLAAALTPGLGASADERSKWLNQAQADLDFGLGNAPARGVAWAQLAAARQAIGGPSVKVVAALMMSIATAPMMEVLWPSRLRLILNNWQFFTPKEREQIASYVATTWRQSADRRFFASVIHSPLDELFVRYFVRDEPGAQQELTKWLADPNVKRN
ncbi:MAG: hypothetical protein ISP49_01310 [Reyranella sp.]|nr:hypothetical protein [Reyranella sp.]MBL6650200.1 hypothetical protein [Reyranella sp.]